jgi:hypothetical protein
MPKRFRIIRNNEDVFVSVDELIIYIYEMIDLNHKLDGSPSINRVFRGLIEDLNSLKK